MNNRSRFNDDTAEVFVPASGELPAPEDNAEEEAKRSDVQDMWDAINSLGSRSTITVTILKKEEGKLNDYAQIVTVPGDEFNQALIDEIQELKGEGFYKVKFVEKGKPRSARTMPLRLSATLNQLRRARDQSQRQSTDPQIMALLSQQTEILRQIQQQQQQQQPVAGQPLGLKDLLEAMVMMKQITGEDRPKTDPLEYVMQGVKMFREIGGNGGAETNVNDIIVNMLKTIQESNKMPRQQRPLGISPTVPPIPPPILTQPAAIKPHEDKYMLEIFQIASGLLSAAKAGINPVNMAVTVIKGSDIEKIEEWTNDPQLFTNLAALVPELKNHRTWFDQLLFEVKRLIELEYEEENEGGNHNGAPIQGAQTDGQY